MTYEELIGACEVISNFCVSHEQCKWCPLSSVCSYNVGLQMDVFINRLKEL